MVKQYHLIIFIYLRPINAHAATAKGICENTFQRQAIDAQISLPTLSNAVLLPRSCTFFILLLVGQLLYH